MEGGIMGFIAKGSIAEIALDDDAPLSNFSATPASGLLVSGGRSSSFANESLVRGQALRGTIAALGSFFSASQVAEILAFLPPEAKQLVGGLATTRWYPLSWSIAIHQGARIVSKRGVELSYELGKRARMLDARGLYRFLLRFSSPELFIRHSDRLMSLYADGPTIQFGPISSASSAEEQRCRVSVRLDHCYAFDENIWQHALGSIDGVFELSGAKNCRIEVTDGGGDSSALAAEVHWTR